MQRMLRRAGLFGLVVALSSVIALSQSIETRFGERLAELNKSIVQHSESGLRGQEIASFESAAKERRKILSEMIESSPAEALRYAISPDLVAKVPAPYAKLFERRVQMTGELEIISECEEHNSRTERFVKTKEGKFEIFFQDAPDELTGSTISVSGISIDGKVAVESYEAGPEELSNTTGERKVLVILVNFQDKQTQPFTAEHARNVVFNTTSSYYYENSYGQTTLTGDVSGWHTIPVNSTSCDLASITTYAEQAAVSAGINLALYQHRIYGFPRIAACGFSGRGSVGGNPSQAWINSDRFGLEVVGHEFGHNLGLWHSRSLDCGADVVGNNCSMSEYGDAYDLMGAAVPAHVNLFQKERLGWVNSGSSPPISSVSAGGIYRIEPLSIAGSTPKGLKIPRSTDPVTGQKTWYYVEHRTPTGFDSSLAFYNVQYGVVVHSGSESDGSDIYLLDMTPDTTEWTDSFLGVGRSFTDSTAGVKITTISADDGGAWVRVEMNAQPSPSPSPTPSVTPTPAPSTTPTPIPCVRTNPNVSITPGRSNWVAAGASASYQLTIRNNNSGNCGSERFNFAANLPTALSAIFSAANVDLVNGATGVADVYVMSSNSAADGTYNFAVSALNATNPAYSASGSAQHVVVSRLVVTATSGAAKYSRNQTAVVTATVTAGGEPVPNATVTFSMSRPAGRAVYQTVTTGSDGRASFSYKFNRKTDAAGTYTVNAVATLNGISGSGSASFVAK